MFGVIAAVMLLAGLALSNPTTSNQDWDGPIDIWVEFAKDSLVSMNQQEFAVDDIEEDFMVDLGFASTPGRLVAREGSIRDISTLERRGGATAVRTNGETKLTVRLGWKTLNLTFGYFRFDALDLFVEGDLEGKIKANCVEVTVAFNNVDGECVWTLDDLKFVEFGNFDLKVNGLGTFNFLASSIVHLIAERHRETMVANTERKLKVLVATAIQKGLHCEEYASLLALPLN